MGNVCNKKKKTIKKTQVFTETVVNDVQISNNEIKNSDTKPLGESEELEEFKKQLENSVPRLPKLEIEKKSHSIQIIKVESTDIPKNSSILLDNSPNVLGSRRFSNLSNASSATKKKRKVRETQKIFYCSANNFGQKNINQYTLHENLGSGSFGKVKLASKHLLNKEEFFAIKIFKKSYLKKKREYIRDNEGNGSYKDALQDVEKEIGVMKKLNHPNVIRLHEVINDPESDKLYLVLDYAKEGQLIEWEEDENEFINLKSGTMSEFSEDYLRKIFRDLHENGIIHRDLKPQNILLDAKGTAKIADFGVACIFDSNKSDQVNNVEGTYFFLAPEAISLNSNGKSSSFSGRAADIWALGITFYAFTFLKLPFFGMNITELVNNLQYQEGIAEHPWINLNLPNLTEEMDVDIVLGNEEIEHFVIPFETIFIMVTIFLFIFFKKSVVKQMRKSISSKIMKPINNVPSLFSKEHL